MPDYFTVKPENEPTEAQAREKASSVWTEWMKNSMTFKEEGRAEFIEQEWGRYLKLLRAKAGDPLPTADYADPLPDYGDLMPIADFRASVRCGGFIDYDGYGRPVKGDKMARIDIYPSLQHLLPLDATHIMWFNR